MRSNQWPTGLRLALAAMTLCLAPAWLSAQEPAPAAPAVRLEQAKQSFEEKRAEIEKKFEAAKGDADYGKLNAEYKALVKQAVNEVRAIAEEAGGTETAASAWSFVLLNAPNAGNKELAGKAFDILLDKHLASPAWEEIAPMIGYLPQMGLGEEKVERAMRLLMEKSPFKGVQAAAMFGLGSNLVDQEDKAKHAEGVAMLKRVQKDFAGVKEAKEFVQRAEGTLFQIENLKPGMPCPDFEATDETGAKFKLSDYKGKVVLIDFWGYW